MASGWQNFTAEILWTALAVVGGTARALDAYIRTGVAPKIGMFAAHAFVSGFSGYMTALTVTKFDPTWATIAAGVGGYLGTQALDWVSQMVQSRFGAQNAAPPKSPDPKG